MKEMFGASMTKNEKEEAKREMEKSNAERSAREMADRFGATMTRGEMKSIKRETRKGKR
jgi:hypothetical protein